MPMYDYECSKCGTTKDHVRPYEDRDEPPRCVCGGGMERKFSFRGGAIPEREPGFQPAFGKTFSSKRGLREEIRKLRYERGIDMVEVGNERLKGAPPSGKPVDKKAAYDMLRRMSRGR